MYAQKKDSINDAIQLLCNINSERRVLIMDDNLKKEILTELKKEDTKMLR